MLSGTQAEKAAQLAHQRTRSEGRIPTEVGPRNTPGRLRLLTALSVLATLVMVLMAWLFVSDAQEGVDVVGHEEGPRVVASADLYQTLADMDTQVANIMLADSVGSDAGVDRDDLLAVYEQRRADANGALLQAAQLAADDSDAERTIREAMDALGRYEQLSGEVVALSAQQSGGLDPDEETVALYREASRLMSQELLPRAYNITLESGSVVRATYEANQESLTRSQVLLAAAGVVGVGLLVALHVYLRVRFRRRFNPAVAGALLVAVLLGVSVVNVLGSTSEQLRTAKEGAFDSVLALAQARALSSSAHGDQSRYVLDAGRSDTYEQQYLEGVQSVLYVEAGNLDDYTDAGSSAISAAVEPGGESEEAELLGPLGEQTSVPGLSQEQDAQLEEVLRAYEAWLQADARMRAGDRDAAAASQIILQGDDSVTAAHAEFDTAVAELGASYEETFEQAVARSDGQLGPWNWLLPLGAVLIIGLTLLGVRPRLAEYTENR